jgi:DNA (cytosine-5)-methyltransferase 1
MRNLDLFSGIGGFTYAGEKLVGGITTTQFVENNKFCQEILKKHWPDIPIHDDIRTFNATQYEYDSITAGFPCQDLSVAGKQRGIGEGTRSSLFYEILRLARQIRPKFILLENVRNLLSHQDGKTFQEILFQIAKIGYSAEWSVVSAKDVGACHRRERVWIIAYPNHYGQQRGEFKTCNQNVAGQDTQIKWTANTENFERQNNDGFNNKKSRINADLSGSPDGGETTSSYSGGVRGLSQRTDNGKGTSSQDNYQENNDRTLVSQGQSRVQSSEYRRLERDQTTFEINSIRQRDDNNPDQRMDIQEASCNTEWRATKHTLNPDWEGYISEPTICRGDDGLSDRVDILKERLRSLGNSIVPQAAAIPLQRIKDLNEQFSTTS